MKKFLIIISIIIIAVGGFLVWYFMPINVINRAFEKDDYEIIVEKYSKLTSDKDRENVKNRSIELVDKYYNAYLRESKDYKEVSRFYKLFMSKEFGEDDAFITYRERFEIIKESRDNFSLGEKYMQDGQYLEALEYFEKVSDEDKLYRRRTESNMAVCEEKYINQIIDDADKLVEAKEYSAAYAVLTEAYEKFSNNEMLSKKLEIVLELVEKDVKESENISGQWYAKCDMGNILAAELGIAGSNISFPLDMVFDITDANINLYVDEKSIKPALQYLTDNSMDELYKLAEGYGIGRKEADTFVKWTYRGSYPDFIMDYFKDDINEALKSVACQYSYVIDDNCIVLTDSSGNVIRVDYLVVNGELHFEKYEGKDNRMNLFDYPVILKRR